MNNHRTQNLIRRVSRTILLIACSLIVGLVAGCSNKTTTPAPEIIVNPTAIQFAATEGDRPEGKQSITIEVHNIDHPNWRATSTADWLSVTPTSGIGNTSSLDLEATSTVLKAGLYKAYVRISSSSNTEAPSPESVEVTYKVVAIVKSPAKLILSGSSFGFTRLQNGPLPAAQYLDVTNGGDETLKWTCSEAIPWLDVSPQSGTDNSRLTLTLNESDLPPGTYRDSFTFYANNAANATQKCYVSYTVQQNEGKLSVDKSSIQFTAPHNGALPLPEDLTLTNIGGAALDWSIDISAEGLWLVASSKSGHLNPGDRTTISLNVTRTTLPFGPQPPVSVTARNVTTDNDAHAIVVNYNLLGAHIVRSEDSLVYEALQGKSLPLPQGFQISNSGPVNLNWSINTGDSWLSVTPSIGVENGFVFVSATTSDLEPGEYRSNVFIVSNDADNSGCSVQIIYKVKGPHVVTDQSALAFTAARGQSLPDTKVLKISNSGGGLLSWTLDDDANWLSISPISGGENAAVSISVNTTLLDVGVHNASITITSNADNSPLVVPVSFAITAPPHLELTPGQLSFQAFQNDVLLPESKSLTIHNSGGDGLRWKVAPITDSWLSVTPTAGANDGSLTVEITRSDLPIGQYTSTITVNALNADNLTQTCTVTYLVKERPPVLCLDISAMNFSAQSNGTPPASQVFRITNCGGGTLAWNISIDQPWLKVSPVSGTNNQLISVSILQTSLDPGVRTATITVNGNSSNSPLKIGVTYNLH